MHVKNMNHVPCAEMAKDHLKTCVVDIAASDLRISPENFLKIEFRVQEIVVDELLKNGSDIGDIAISSATTKPLWTF